ncbi:MAG: argininosuccinate lyase [Candidatus Omnitrophica bacterium]|nr:argininosuccinate lyase [Candidatus Omnitrophota bacterium]
MKKQKLWGGRFTKKTARVIEEFSHSFAVDSRLARWDLVGSIAHARMLGKTGIIPKTDSVRLVRTLTGMLASLEKGTLRLDPTAEDIHTAIQTALEKRAGAAAGRLHTARSRNDQVVTSFRLYCKDHLEKLTQAVLRLQKTVLRQAEAAGTLVLPGYTHLRHAQPVLAAHLLVSYVVMLQRDRERLREAARRLDELPLGSAALTGTSLAIDRASVARELGFSRVAENSIDAVTERDFAVEILSSLAILGVHLSRIAEDLLLWSTAEFGFLSFSEELLTGSSMMPQKQNPDFLELTRGGSARLIGNLTGIAALLKGLSSGYQRDLQLDKELVFEGLDRAAGMLAVMTAGFQSISWNGKKISEQMEDDSLYATDIAEYLVAKGVPFSEAHQIVGRLLSRSEKEKGRLRSLPLEIFRRFSPFFNNDVYRLFDPDSSVGRKRSAGSTQPAAVARSIQSWKKRLQGRGG